MKVSEVTTVRSLVPALVVGGAFLLAACEGGGGSSSSPNGAAEIEIPDVDVPTVEEAEAEAAAEISPENADAAFEELMREIDEDVDE